MDTVQQPFLDRIFSKKGTENVDTTIDTNKTTIIDLIVKCSKEATKKPKESKFTESLKELVLNLKEIFKSEYCAIGTVDEKYVRDRACTLNGLSRDEKWAPIESQSCLVCKALGYTYKSTDRKLITTYSENEIRKAGNYEKYKEILKENPKNTTIVIIQDNDGDPQGYLQFINSEIENIEEDYKSYQADMLRLAFVVKQWFALVEERLFLKDFEFINGIDGTNNVDNLFFKIMEYLSTEFNAGIISYRIPLLIGTNRKPVFFLRDCYVSEIIEDREHVKKSYFSDRLLKTQDKMGGVNELICKNHDRPVFLVEPTDFEIKKEVNFKKNVVIIPIIRDYSEKDICINNDRVNKDSLCDNGDHCVARFEKYFGIFKLRILKGEDEDGDDSIPEEVNTRLYNLAKHISVLFNAVVDKNENESLNKFQIGINDSSFTDYAGINVFDLQCAKTIKQSTGAELCAIYKYDKLSNEMVLSASIPQKIEINTEKLSIDSDLKKAIESCRNMFSLEENVINRVFERDEPVYYIFEKDCTNNCMMLVPMIKKSGTRIGMILLVGKGNNGVDVSKTFWEHDKNQIKFIVDILSRIEESDADRLVFLLRLSHELRKPITEMVYKNDFLQSTAERNKDSITKKELLEGLRFNMNSCMMFKQIIGDVETTYYMRKGHISYNPENANVKSCLLDVIRLFEQGGWSSDMNLVFDTRLSQMPQTMYVDKEKIKQVFANILKNAIQYSDKYSTITISYNFNEQDNCHEIDFRNYGVGIAKEEEKSIFELWKRGESAKKKRPNGTGMGLSIVKEIMEAHGGKCYVKQLNNPTIFTVSIPEKSNKQS